MVMNGNAVSGNGVAANHVVNGAAAPTIEQTQATIERLKEQMGLLDLRKERMMKSRPTVRSRTAAGLSQS